MFMNQYLMYPSMIRLFLFVLFISKWIKLLGKITTCFSSTLHLIDTRKTIMEFERTLAC